MKFITRSYHKTLKSSINKDDSMIMYIMVLIAGLVFRLVQPGILRVFTILPTFFILGLLTSIFSGYYFVVFGLGMCIKGFLMGAWYFFFLKIVAFSIGLMVGYMFIVPIF